jgi:uncharacterized protein (DUF433 family)
MTTLLEKAFSQAATLDEDAQDKIAAWLLAELQEHLPITIDPNIVSGTPVFRGTRVPVQTLFDYIADGCTLDEFLDNFPTVKREDALVVLQKSTQHLTMGAITHENIAR